MNDKLNQNDKSGTGIEIIKLQVSGYLAEYDAVRSEIMDFHKSLRELILVAFTSIIGISTLFATLYNSGHIGALESFLLIIPLPYFFVILSGIGQGKAGINLTHYQRDYLRPRINELLFPSSSIKVSKGLLYWECYPPRQNKLNRFIAEGLWGLGNLGIIFAPFMGSLIAFAIVFYHLELKMHYWWKILLVIDIVLLLFSLFLICLTLLKRFENYKEPVS